MTVRTFKDWHGPLPKKCQACNAKIKDVFIDGRTTRGTWAIMCPECFSMYGVGLGLGKGQKFVRYSTSEILDMGKDYDSSVKHANELDHDLEYHDKKCEEANENEDDGTSKEEKSNR